MMQRQRMAFSLLSLPHVTTGTSGWWSWPWLAALTAGSQLGCSVHQPEPEWGVRKGQWSLKEQEVRAIVASIPTGCQRPFCQVQVFEPDASASLTFPFFPLCPTFDLQRNPIDSTLKYNLNPSIFTLFSATPLVLTPLSLTWIITMVTLLISVFTFALSNLFTM